MPSAQGAAAAAGSTRTRAERRASQHNSKYKTEMCKNWMEKGTCPYGHKCQFAHGPDDMRLREHKPTYKTRPCQTFIQTGRCPYGTRCKFRHGDDDEDRLLRLQEELRARSGSAGRDALDNSNDSEDGSRSPAPEAPERRSRERPRVRNRRASAPVPGDVQPSANSRYEPEARTYLPQSPAGDIAGHTSWGSWGVMGAVPGPMASPSPWQPLPGPASPLLLANPPMPPEAPPLVLDAAVPEQGQGAAGGGGRSPAPFRRAESMEADLKNDLTFGDDVHAASPPLVLGAAMPPVPEAIGKLLPAHDQVATPALFARGDAHQRPPLPGPPPPRAAGEDDALPPIPPNAAPPPMDATARGPSTTTEELVHMLARGQSSADLTATASGEAPGLPVVVSRSESTISVTGIRALEPAQDAAAVDGPPAAAKDEAPRPPPLGRGESEIVLTIADYYRNALSDEPVPSTPGTASHSSDKIANQLHKVLIDDGVPADSS
mmetsp:Transcript_29377/g.78932  ORF Transcript_29377/g.78932 Transcript_29377/m.78932 type:complete len:490 (-) Transcript_29377:213-1682(-)